MLYFWLYSYANYFHSHFPDPIKDLNIEQKKAAAVHQFYMWEKKGLLHEMAYEYIAATLYVSKGWAKKTILDWKKHGEFKES